MQTEPCSVYCHVPYRPVYNPRRRRRRRSWWRRAESDDSNSTHRSLSDFDGDIDFEDEDYYGLRQHGSDLVVSTAPHSHPTADEQNSPARRRLEYFTTDPGIPEATCTRWSDFVPASDIPSIVQNRQNQVEQCANVTECHTECNWIIGGDLNTVGDARLRSATDPDVFVEMPFFARIKGSIDLPEINFPLPEVPNVVDAISDIQNPNQEPPASTFMGTPCRDIAELASAFADDVGEDGFSATVEARSELLIEKVKVMAKKKVEEKVAEAKRDALASLQPGGDSEGAQDGSHSLISELKVGLVTMGRMDYVENLADTLCGLVGSDDPEGCVGSLPAVEMTNVAATLQVASTEMTVANINITLLCRPTCTGN
eukprot:SAG11_NODE_638_length_8025_cov_14.591093_5_plen_370_part_00